jgi:hypothetical protein
MPNHSADALHVTPANNLWAQTGHDHHAHARIFVPNTSAADGPRRSPAASGLLDDFFSRFPAIPAGRKPALGFILGVAFGPLVAIYLRSWFDFFLIVAAIVLVTAGLFMLDATSLAQFAPVLWGMWALLRIRHSRTH